MIESSGVFALSMLTTEGRTANGVRYAGEYAKVTVLSDIVLCA